MPIPPTTLVYITSHQILIQSILFLFNRPYVAFVAFNRVNHGITHHTTIESRGRMPYQFLVQVDSLGHIIRSGRRESRMYAVLCHYRQICLLLHNANLIITSNIRTNPSQRCGGTHRPFSHNILTINNLPPQGSENLPTLKHLSL